MAVKRKSTPGARRRATPAVGVRPVRPSMVTLSDAETTETARRESMKSEGSSDRATMPAPPAAIGSFSIEMNVPAAEIDFKASFERGAYREALTAARERLSVSPADTSALRIAQRAEEALAFELVSALGGLQAQAVLARVASEGELDARDELVVQRLIAGPAPLSTLLAAPDMGRVETLDRIAALQARGYVRVNLSDQKKTASERD